MLERASLCLESGGRHLLRGSSPTLRSRRMLHSSFWHHGAGDLDLPAWWASVLHPPDAEPAAALAAGRSAAVYAAPHDGLFLDFLYPEKTLALMRRISSFGWKRWSTRNVRLVNGGRLRQFSSKTHGPPDSRDEHSSNEAATDAPTADNPFGQDGPSSAFDNSPTGSFGDISPMPLGRRSELDDEFFSERDDAEDSWLAQVDNAPEALRKLLDAGESDSRAVWKLWCKVDEADRTPDLAATVLDYLCSIKPFRPIVAERAIEIFNSLATEDRRPSSFQNAIRAYVALDRLERAALTYQDGLEAGEFMAGKIGSPELIALAIKKGQWQVAVKAYASMTRLSGVSKVYWATAKKELDLRQHLVEFLIHVRRLRRLTGRDPEEIDQIRAFVADFADQAIQQVVKSASTPLGHLNLWSLISRLKQCSFLEPGHYELALVGLLTATRKASESGRVPEIARRLYWRYIKAATADPSAKLDAKVLYAMASHLSHSTQLAPGTRLGLGHVVYHWRKHRGTYSLPFLKLVMMAYARRGDVGRVRNFFKIVILEHRPKGLHWDIAWPMVYVYARRGDVAGAVHEIKEMQERFKLRPSAQLWNIVLHACARNDDLEEATRRFDDIIKSVKPDAYTFSAILDLMAQRGDVDGVKEMLALAADTDQSILRSTQVAGYLVSAFINNDELDTAERVAEQLRTRTESGAMKGSLTPIWNNLATAYALRRDVQSTRRIYEQMQAYGIEPDAQTYAALLQALCMIRETDSAWKILRTVIPRKPVKQLALHYAIVMAGFINQEKFEKVWHVDHHRRAQGVRATISTRIAAIKAAAMSEYVGRYSHLSDSTRKGILERTERLLVAMLENNDPLQVSLEPQTGLGTRLLEQSEGSYMEFLVLLYGNMGALQMVERLFNEYASRQDVSLDDPQKAPPMRMLVALMHTHFRAERYDEVEKCWDLALHQATRLAQLHMPTAASNLAPDTSDADNNDNGNSNANGNGTAANNEPPRLSIAPSRRYILGRPLTIFLRTLHFQGRYADAQRTVSGIVAAGFEPDNLSWNLYVQLLARTGRISAAFGLCEQYLMPAWRGWRVDDAHLRRRYRAASRGWEYQNVNPNRVAPGTLLPQYRTMVILAAAMKYVRRMEAVGWGSARPGEAAKERLSEAVLRVRAPRTVAALQAMPFVDDDLQARYLRTD